MISFFHFCNMNHQTAYNDIYFEFSGENARQVKTEIFFKCDFFFSFSSFQFTRQFQGQFFNVIFLKIGKFKNSQNTSDIINSLKIQKGFF